REETRPAGRAQTRRCGASKKAPAATLSCSRLSQHRGPSVRDGLLRAQGPAQSEDQQVPRGPACREARQGFETGGPENQEEPHARQSASGAGKDEEDGDEESRPKEESDPPHEGGEADRAGGRACQDRAAGGTSVAPGDGRCLSPPLPAPTRGPSGLSAVPHERS